MPTQGRRATAGDRAEDRSLLHTEPRMLRDEGVTLRVEDIGHLQHRPRHGTLGRNRFSRDRGTARGVGTASRSRGFGAAWRWRGDRWRSTVVWVRSA